MLHELLSRDHADGCATWQPQGARSEAYLSGTSQGPTPEYAGKDRHIPGRSKRFIKYPGYGGLPKMKLACNQCNKTLKTLDQDDFTMMLHSDEGVYFFCSKSCKDSWSRPVITEEELDSLKQSSL